MFFSSIPFFFFFYFSFFFGFLKKNCFPFDFSFGFNLFPCVFSVFSSGLCPLFSSVFPFPFFPLFFLLFLSLVSLWCRSLCVGVPLCVLVSFLGVLPVFVWVSLTFLRLSHLFLPLSHFFLRLPPFFFGGLPPFFLWSVFTFPLVHGAPCPASWFRKSQVRSLLTSGLQLHPPARLGEFCLAFPPTPGRLVPSTLALRGRAEPSHRKAETNMVSIASWTPRNMGNPSATTSYLRASPGLAPRPCPWPGRSLSPGLLPLWTPSSSAPRQTLANTPALAQAGHGNRVDGHPADAWTWRVGDEGASEEGAKQVWVNPCFDACWTQCEQDPSSWAALRSHHCALRLRHSQEQPVTVLTLRVKKPRAASQCGKFLILLRFPRRWRANLEVWI